LGFIRKPIKRYRGHKLEIDRIVSERNAARYANEYIYSVCDPDNAAIEIFNGDASGFDRATSSVTEGGDGTGEKGS